MCNQYGCHAQNLINDNIKQYRRINRKICKTEGCFAWVPISDRFNYSCLCLGCYYDLVRARLNNNKNSKNTK